MREASPSGVRGTSDEKICMIRRRSAENSLFSFQSLHSDNRIKRHEDVATTTKKVTKKKDGGKLSRKGA